MIIDSTSSNKITIGQTTEYKTSIDIENLDFIATLLSSNLYSNPEESFIREIVSNGWDSHVEANNTDTPIIVRMKYNGNYGHDITIRDYGTGLSKEQFENLFCKIGSSTKRESNAYLGAFGLGHLSPLAVSKVCYITSYYNGIARFYVMTKDGNNITTNLMSETSTEEHNGLEIVVKNQNKYVYEEAFKDLMFFPNVYIDGDFNDLNSIQIKRFKYFSASSVLITKKILLGNVLYPLQNSIIPSDLKDFYRKFEDSGLVLNFNIGELTVTPNRESIIYNNKTTELIIQRLKDAKEEITNIINPYISKDFVDPYAYYDLIKDGYSFDFINNQLLEPYYRRSAFRFNKDIIVYNATLKGTVVAQNNLFTIKRCQGCVPKYRGTIINDKVYTSEKKTWDCRKLAEDPNKNILIIPSDQKLTCYIKSWLTICNHRAVICGVNTYEDFLNCYLKNYSPPTPDEEFLIKICYEHFKSKSTVLDLENDKEFLEYKEELKRERKEKNNTDNIKDVILTICSTQYGYGIPTKRRFNTYAQALEFIKKLKGGTIYRNLDALQIYNVAVFLNYNVIGANKTILKALENENFTSEITEKEILNHPKIIKLRTLKESNLVEVIRSIPANFVSTLPKEMQEAYLDIRSIIKYNYETGLYISEHKEDIPIDEEALNMYNTIAKCYNEYTTILTELNVENITTSINEIIAYIIMKNRLYKIGYDCYKHIKNNKIISRLCKK